jgi:glycosyltransferase involved in cell wall biosynthesis
MKILLVGFKLSIGNELYMNMLYKHLKESGNEVNICGDSNYTKKYNVGRSIANGGNAKQMMIDTINPINWVKFYKLLKKNKYEKIFFISSHTLNNVAILIAKFYNIETISHIHDPIPHSGTKYGKIILLSQKFQAKISNKIIVYGQKLKNIIKEVYNINENKIFIIKHGVYRDNKETFEVSNKKFISLLGRIDEYKGIDIFLKAIK